MPIFSYNGFERITIPTNSKIVSTNSGKRILELLIKIADEFKDVPTLGFEREKILEYSRQEKMFYYTNEKHEEALDDFNKILKDEDQFVCCCLEGGEAGFLSRIDAISKKVSVVLLYDINPLTPKHHAFEINCMRTSKTRAEFFKKYLTWNNPYCEPMGGLGKLKLALEKVVSETYNHFLSSDRRYIECYIGLSKVYTCLIFLNIRDLVLCQKLGQMIKLGFSGVGVKIYPSFFLKYINVSNISDYDFNNKLLIFYQSIMAHLIPGCLYRLAQTKNIVILHSSVHFANSGNAESKKQCWISTKVSRSIKEFIISHLPRYISRNHINILNFSDRDRLNCFSSKMREEKLSRENRDLNLIGRYDPKRYDMIRLQKIKDAFNKSDLKEDEEKKNHLMRKREEEENLMKKIKWNEMITDMYADWTEENK